MNSEVQQTPEKVGRFRALIIGRPNAGKTTILRRIAQSADGGVSVCFTSTPLVSTNDFFQRGIHNVKDELVFSSNPGFVFHEAGGIEAGSTTEMENIQAFISERANAMSLEEKLHAIWYCIPTDNSRLVTFAEERFFDNLDPDGVPVVLIFTKFECEEAEAFRKLLKPCSNVDLLLEEVPRQAREDFDQKHLHRFIDRKYAPKAIAYLKGEFSHLPDIIEQTMKALNNDTLKWLLASVQKVDPKLRIKEMLQR
ncbi:hypothetical protein M413DRAFT_67850 [Hebeloma cylindrosporum]|uniref:G domain-containing protein n=1 Tax=Hebeloma cylindrosporum TaxID=76867 RepID=A0A0C2YT57_HEBCY|nr:hypothetical protein M413DRAFT_67850 [Hebeloma cylindrosporum h7]